MKPFTPLLAITAALSWLAAPPALDAQSRRGGPPPSARAAAPIDLTGYWTAVITEDYHLRMFTAAKGERMHIPYNSEGAQEAMKWDPAKDQAEGNPCKAFGAPGIMRQPTNLHITWQDENTLKVEADFGMQTRLFHFAPPPQPGQVWFLSGAYRPAQAPKVEPPPGLEPGLQGYSIASFWNTLGGDNPQEGAQNAEKSGELKVATTHLKPGYYWRNGVPYSAGAVLTEHFRVIDLPDRSVWLSVVQIVEDPKFLTQPFVVNYQFKKLPDGSKWKPIPCSVK